MKSIRLSLIVYFLLLLAVGLGAAFLLAYDSAAGSLLAKQRVSIERLNSQFEADQARIGKQFDDDLRTQAFDMAKTMALQNQWTRPSFLRITPIALIGQPQAHLAAPIWIAEATRGRIDPATRRNDSPLNLSMTTRLLSEVSFSEIDLPHAPDLGEHEFYQINAEWSPPWHSRSLGAMQLPYDANEFANKDLYYSQVDDIALASDLRVRRVQLKVPAARFLPPRTARGNASGGSRGGSPPVPPQPPPESAPQRTDPTAYPWIVIHCAADTARREAALTALRTELNAKLAEQAVEGREELSRLSQRLVLIGLGAFAATALGAYFMLGFGLSPLRRLSDAVSRVSPRDFKFPLTDNATLGTELAPIADRLRETLDQLRRVFEREKQAAADISHELRTPVASLLATLDVALRKPRTADEYRQTLVDCRAVGGQMRQLVERIMALARLDAGSDHIRMTEIDVGELIGDVATMVNPLAAERGLTLRAHCAESQLCRTDPDKLREILVNLLHNAIQYNRPGGEIDVSADMANGWLNLRVRDSGVGIAPEAREHIFERFYRADPSRNGSGLHAGLGLSIVKGYVALLGGTVMVESELGKGSTFQVRVPTGEAAKSKPARPTIAAAL
jgi:signal transduction histidine kinase